MTESVGSALAAQQGLRGVQDVLPIAVPHYQPRSAVTRRRVEIPAGIDFHRAFGLPRRAEPTTDVRPGLAALRLRLLAEESHELEVGMANGDLVAIADALADITYVVFGTAITYGVDLEAVVREVHRANMSKLDAHGRPILREDGKVLKSDRYLPPNVSVVIALQPPLF
jgi:predicted HAD superfamily Cof-like phosphohydrolase